MSGRVTFACCVTESTSALGFTWQELQHYRMTCNWPASLVVSVYCFDLSSSQALGRMARAGAGGGTGTDERHLVPSHHACQNQCVGDRLL